MLKQKLREWGITGTIHLTTIHLTTIHLTTIQLATIHLATIHLATIHLTTIHLATIHLATIHLATIHLTTIHLTTIHLTTIHLTTIHLATIHLATIHLTTIHLTTIHLTTIHLTTIHLTTIQLATIHLATIHLATIHQSPSPKLYSSVSTLLGVIMERAISALGLIVFLAVSYGLSVNRRAVRSSPIAWGLGLEFVFALLILKTPGGLAVFKSIGDVVSRFLAFSDVGAKFVFGDKYEENFFAFKVLPTIIFFSAFVTVLYHYGIVQRVIKGMAWVMVKTMKISGAESLSCAGNIFLGPTESPLLIKPYVSSMTQSELFAVMTAGFATIAGGVLGAYLSFGIPTEHLIAAFFMTAPTAMVVAKLLYPETEQPKTAGKVQLDVHTTYVNAIDAATVGAMDGMKIAVSVAVIIIAFLGLLAGVNALLGWFGGLFGLPQLSLEWMLSYLMAPVAWLMGVPWRDCPQVGVLLGKKTILNDFIAYLDLKTLIEKQQISQRAIIIATYALCNFANLGSIGITVAGIAAIAPNRQQDLARMGVLSMIGGLLAGFITACIAGMLI